MPGKVGVEKVRLEKVLRYAGLVLCFVLGFLAALGGTAMAAQQEGGANYAVLYDGLNDYVDLNGVMLGGPASVTVEAWVRIDALNKVHYLVTNADNDFNDGFSLIVDQSGRVNFVAASGLYVKGIALSATLLQVGQWHHVAGVYDAQNGQVKVYVDGLEETVVPYADGIRYLTARDLKLGSQNKAYERAGRFLKGALDEVRIWNVARDANDILASMKVELSGTESGFVGYWQKNEGSGVNAADMVGGNNGQLKMGPQWIEAPWRAVSEQQIAIDIKPGGNHNVVMLTRRTVPVAMLSAADFDALSEIDLPTVTFGRTGSEPSLETSRRGRPKCSRRDVNHDGLRDLVCLFNVEATGFEKGDTKGILMATTTSGVQVTGSDDIIVRGRRFKKRDDNKYGDKDDDGGDDDGGDDDGGDDDDKDDRRYKRRGRH